MVGDPPVKLNTVFALSQNGPGTLDTKVPVLGVPAQRPFRAVHCEVVAKLPVVSFKAVPKVKVELPTVEVALGSVQSKPFHKLPCMLTSLPVMSADTYVNVGVYE